ncbi:hypothetical protein [Salinibacterium sp. PAMC 21357]|uniref:hypothetical protein n=1 Tax=Salinibacterium sp. PAMC 21357 TaxID=1112215 RepID=UPI000287DF26|nr:hypothetical protein [Salinibacterium sp. PAMC 21357]
MSFARWAITAIARTLPTAAATRYGEEWQADLDGAAELDLPATSIVWGAAIIAITIDRDAPEVTGITLTAVAARRARWALGAFISAGILGAGLFLWGGYHVPQSSSGPGAALLAAAALILKVAAITFSVVGVLATVRAIITQVAASRQNKGGSSRTFRLRPSSVTVWLLAAVVITVALLMLVPLVVVVVAVLATPIALTIAASSNSSHDRVPIRRRTQWLVAVTTVLLTFATVAIGTLHIVVWNPLAAVPGLSLDAIYAQMAAAGESPFPYLIWSWGVFWSLAALAFGGICLAPKLGGRMSARALAASGLTIVGLTLLFHGFAGFNMGMSLADTFAIGGGDTAPSGPALAILGQLCLVTIVWLLLLPQRTNAGRLPEQSTRVVTN